MPIALRMPLLVAVALLLGIAMWGGEPAAAHTGVAAGGPPTGASKDLLPDGGERDLVRALLMLLPEPVRADALVAETVTQAVFVGRAVHPEAITQGRGVFVRDLAAGQRALVQRLFAHAFALAAATAPEPVGAVPLLPDDAAFAIAGDAARGRDLYVRWHLPAAVCEWVGFAAGDVHARWREFGVGSQEWLGAALARRLAR
ncbi:MAG: DUF3500 domain-containing protein [Planctomycetes bacterium]|nr:DUF3500 domain-containing protein [Planctomycetota bacterium]